MTRIVILAAASAAMLAPSAMAKPCDLEDVAAAYLASFNSFDPAAIEAVLSPDYAIESPYGTFDRDGFVGLNQAAWYAFPDILYTQEELLVDAQDSKFAIRYAYVGTFTNDFLGYVALGQTVVGRGMEVNDVDEDTCLVTETRNYSDAFTLFSQLQ